MGDLLFFSAGDQFEPGANRVLHQLWVSLGTPNTTVKLSADLVDPETPFVAYRDEVYFMGNNEDTGWELHKSDGSVLGTQMVADLNNGGDDAFSIPKIVFDDELIFLADNGSNGFEIWTWNGNRTELAEVHLGGGGFTQEPERFQFTPFGNDLLFSGSTPFEGDELFVIRGQGITSSIPGDADGNGIVEFADFLILSSNFGRADGVTRGDGDFDGSGVVDFADFLVLSANYGRQAE